MAMPATNHRFQQLPNALTRHQSHHTRILKRIFEGLAAAAKAKIALAERSSKRHWEMLETLRERWAQTRKS
jgi:hypothetical protein